MKTIKYKKTPPKLAELSRTTNNEGEMQKKWGTEHFK
jgi:hypothetical protein